MKNDKKHRFDLWELQEAGFPDNGALSLEYEENEKDPLADIRECFVAAKSAMQEVSKPN